MKKLLAILITLFCCATVQAQTNSGQLIASQYGQWTVAGYAPNSYQFAPNTCRVQGGSSYFFAFAVGTPIKIVDGNPNLNEIVTPSSITDSNVTCAVSIAPLNNHQLPFSLTSGTGGLQEALNANVAAPQKNTIILDANWYQLVGASNAQAVIAAAQGSAQLGLVDQTQVPYVWYQWNGTQYVPVALGGTCTSNSCVISLNSLQGAVTLNQGANITLTPGTNSLTISAVGGSGVQGGPWNVTRYGAATGTAVPSPSPSLYQVDNTTTLAQMNALIASLSVGGGSNPAPPYAGLGTIFVPDGTNFTGWYNATSGSGSGNSGVGIVDIRSGVHSTPLSQWGVPAGAGSPGCAHFQGSYGFTQGSTTVTVGGSEFAASDVGNTMVVTGLVGGVPTRFTPTIVSVGTGSATISTPAPFTETTGAIIGYLSTGNFQNAMTGLGIASTSTALFGQIPSGCALLTDTIAWNGGQSLVGDSASTSVILGLPGDDIFQNPDGAGLGSVSRPGLRFGGVTLVVNQYIDATKTWNDVNASGTTTVHQPLYRPLGELTQPANDPLGPGWAQGPGAYNSGAQNFTASLTSGQPVMCVPAAYFSRLTAGHQEVFRDTATIFKSTISSLTGAGCAAGFSGVTLTSNAPATIAQAEGVDTTSIQNLGVAMTAGTNTFPLTITVANPTTPVPGFESNVAGHGRVKIGSEEYDYQGGNNALASSGPYTLILRDGPATTVGWAIGTPVVPENPCSARYETPWPVIPTINSGDSTPSGSTFFPAFCVGNAAISMPEANANTYLGSGFTNSHIQDVIVTSSGPVNQNSAACYYVGGNNASYETVYDGIQCIGQQYGIVQGPASAGQHGVAAASATGFGNHYSNLVLRNAVNTVFDQLENSSIDRIGGYSTAYSAYDGTAIGDYTVFLASSTYDEQTGAGVSNVNFLTVSNCNWEPENGSHIEVPVYAELDLYGGKFTGCSFEGSYNYLGGARNNIPEGQLSGSAALPVIDFGFQNVVEDTIGTSIGPVSNTFGTGSFLEWGSYARTGAYSAGGYGPKAASAVGTREGYDGDDSFYAVTGNFAKPYVNLKSGYISAEEFASAGMGAKTLDATELKQGSFTTCGISPSGGCNATEFNGFDGYLLIGLHDRFQPEPYTLYMNMKMATGTANPVIYIRAQSTGSGCSAGTVSTFAPNLTSTWTTYATKIDLSSYAGCALTFTFGPTFSGSGTLQLGATNLLPTAQVNHLPVNTYTSGAACPSWAVAGDDLGIDATSQYFCGSGSTIVAQALSGTSGITALTGDVTASGSGSAAATVKAIGGGPALASLAAGPLCNNGTAGQGILCTNLAVSGTVSGTSITGATVINGVYTVPSSATSVFNISTANSQNLVLAQNTTTTLSAGSAGGEFVSFRVCENPTGGYSFAWPTNFFFFPAINTAASQCTVVTGYWDGTNVWSSGSMPNVFTTLGDTVYSAANGVATRLAGNTATQPGFYSETGTGTISAAPVWTSSSGSGSVCLTTNCIMTTPNLGNATATSLTVNGSGVATMALGSADFITNAGVPTGCGTTYPNGSLYINTTGSHASTDLLYVCDAATSTWIDIE